eukprot:Tbor_TRINITY_DN5521_c4_g1::TRINITY_DN5521_c4_g1_i1::g.13019::m.13019
MKGPRNISFRSRDITILDRVYEHIALPPIITAVVDTPQFQRLRGLKQLGASSFLYPGAVHTRFEHSIGVSYLAKSFLDTLRHKQPEMGISDEDVECAMLAGLCHDLGHGPFSHLFEDVIVKKVGVTDFCHEKMSEKLLMQIKDELHLDPVVVGRAASLMGGRHYHSSENDGITTDNNNKESKYYKPLPFWELISNKRNGIDVDRLDYLVRDSLCCFGKPTIDVKVNRLFNAALIINKRDSQVPYDTDINRDNNSADDEFCLAFEQKMAVTIRELFALRAKLHKCVYQHHVVKAVGYMIGDIIFHATSDQDGLKINGSSLIECVKDPNKYCLLGDWILDAIAAATPISPASSRDTYAPVEDTALGLHEAQRVLHKLRTRDLYTLVSCLNISPTHDNKPFPKGSEIHDQLAEIICKKGSSVVKSDIIVDVVCINHGKGTHDPLKYVDFFNPKDDATRTFTLTGSSPLLSPNLFEENTIMVFSRRKEAVTAIREGFLQWKGNDAANAGITNRLYEGISFHNSRV